MNGGSHRRSLQSPAMTPVGEQPTPGGEKFGVESERKWRRLFGAVVNYRHRNRCKLSLSQSSRQHLRC
jgi:hypothetical protein